MLTGACTPLKGYAFASLEVSKDLFGCLKMRQAGFSHKAGENGDAPADFRNGLLLAIEELANKFLELLLDGRVGSSDGL